MMAALGPVSVRRDVVKKVVIFCYRLLAGALPKSDFGTNAFGMQSLLVGPFCFLYSCE